VYAFLKAFIVAVPIKILKYRYLRGKEQSLSKLFISSKENLVGSKVTLRLLIKFALKLYPHTAPPPTKFDLCAMMDEFARVPGALTCAHTRRFSALATRMTVFLTKKEK
jgi:hypothetical protein